QVYVFYCASSLAQLKVNTITREYFPILPAVIFKRSAFESRGHYDSRWRRRDEIHQKERNNAHNANDRRQSFEQSPTAESQHEIFPPSLDSSWDSNRHILHVAPVSTNLARKVLRVPMAF